MSQNLFEKIYVKNIDALESFALKLTRNKMDADDLVQETAIKAFRNFNKFKSTESFKNWSFTILKNTFITKYNQRKRRKIVTTPIEELKGKAQVVKQIEPKNDSNPKFEYVKHSIKKLSAKSKEPFEMYMNGYSYNEISQYLDIPVGTVKSRINFAKTKLKQYYKDATSTRLQLSNVA